MLKGSKTPLPKELNIWILLRNNLGSNGFLFLQETHSSLADEKKWAAELKWPIFFSDGETNSCGVAIEYIGNNKVDVLNKKKL